MTDIVLAVLTIACLILASASQWARRTKDTAQAQEANDAE